MNNTSNKSTLTVSPSNDSFVTGVSFNSSVGVTTNGNKVCAVEGTLVFNDLSCQNITVAEGVVTQSAPTCSNPHFIVGIEGCTTSNKTLMSVQAQAGTVGSASLTGTGVDVIGEGNSVGSEILGGSYTVSPAAIVKDIMAVADKVTPIVAKNVTNSTTSISVATTSLIDQTSAAENAQTGSPALTYIVIIILVLGMVSYFVAKKKKLIR